MKFSRIALVFALSLNLGLPCLAATIGDADTLLMGNKYKEAEEGYRDLLDSDTTGDAYAGLAVALAKQSWPAKILEAEKILRLGKQKFSDNTNVMAAAGYVSYVHSKTVASPAKRDLYLEAAETLCKRAVKANPDTLIAQQTLGLVKMAQDDVDGAIDPLKKACELSENPVNLTLLAQALLKIDPKDKDATTAIDKALQLNANYYPAHLQKALILTNDGKHEDAFMELRNIPANARTPDWHEIEGDIYRKQGDGPAALASWRESIRLDPHNPEPYKHQAEYYAMRGDGELAISELHNALDILPNDMALRSQVAELALRQDKLDVAETEYRTILASQPDDPQALLGLSRVYFRKARKEGQYPPGWQKLMDQLQTVVTENNVQGRVLKSGAKDLQESIQMNEAEKSLAENRFREARQFFTKVINAHKEDPYNLLTLGEQAYNDGDLRSAEQAYNYAKEIPEVASRADQGISKIGTQRNEAERQTMLGDATRTIPEVAVDHYKQALIADPQFSNAYYGLFTLFSGKKTADPEKAVNYALCFLEAADDSNPMRKEVESEVEKLKQHMGSNAPKKKKGASKPSPEETQDESQSQSESKVETKAKSKAETEAPTEAETEAPTKAETPAESKAEPKAPTKAEPKAPTKAEPKAPTKAEPKAPTKAEPKAPTKPEGKAESKGATKAESKGATKAESKDESSGD